MPRLILIIAKGKRETPGKSSAHGQKAAQRKDWVPKERPGGGGEGWEWEEAEDQSTVPLQTWSKNSMTGATTRDPHQHCRTQCVQGWATH